MDDRLKQAYRRVINKHFSAVQTDTELGITDKFSLERKAKNFWEQFKEAEKDFEALLDRCVIND